MPVKVNFIQTESQYALFLQRTMSHEEFKIFEKSLTEEEIAALNDVISKAAAFKEARSAGND